MTRDLHYEQPIHAAYMATLDTLPTDVLYLTLMSRAKATFAAANRDDRERFAQVLDGVGARLREGPTVLEQMVGLLFQRSAAEACGQESRLAEQEAKRKSTLALIQGNKESGNWPIAALTLEWARQSYKDEMQWLGALNAP